MTNLQNIFCQDRVINSLERAYAAGKVPHAYIFAGPDGVGKFTTAKAFAKLLLCKSPVNADTQNGRMSDSCNTCESCQALESGSHPDLNLVYKELFAFTEEGKKQKIDKETGEVKKQPVSLSIHVIRDFLIAKTLARPMLSSKMVFIIDEAQKMEPIAQNSVLKVLEEPPSYCTIILICSRLEKLLPTIHSRCQVQIFGPIDEKRITQKLSGLVDSRQATYWARYSQGSIGSALWWAGIKDDDISAYAFKTELIEKIASLQLIDAVETAEWIGKQAGLMAQIMEKSDPAVSKSDHARRAVKGAIMMIISALNDAMKLSVSQEQALVNSDQEQQIRRLAARFDPETAAQKVALAYKSLDWVDASVNEKLILEDLLLNLA